MKDPLYHLSLTQPRGCVLVGYAARFAPIPYRCYGRTRRGLLGTCPFQRAARGMYSACFRPPPRTDRQLSAGPPTNVLISRHRVSKNNRLAVILAQKFISVKHKIREQPPEQPFFDLLDGSRIFFCCWAQLGPNSRTRKQQGFIACHGQAHF